MGGPEPIHHSEKKHLLNELFSILSGFPGGIQEYDLLGILQEKTIPVFKDFSLEYPLQLFRWHFLIFHLLYSLRDLLRQERTGDLAIHCLHIALLPYISNETTLPDFPDSLREYYLDLNQIYQVDKDAVSEMIQQFWARYGKFSKRPEALRVLGLSDSATPGAIKIRFRELVLVHHPDKGGDREIFEKISEAASILLD